MSFLLDTSVISELVKPAPDNNVIDWLKRTDEALLYLSVLTRKPTAAERKEVAAYKGNVADLVWALLASTEFRMNH